MTNLLRRLLAAVLFLPAVALTAVLAYLAIVFGGLAIVIRWVATGKGVSADWISDFFEDFVIWPVELVWEIGA